MPLMSSRNYRERLLVFGGPATGKTRGAIDIALMSIASGSNAFFHVIDTDDSWMDMADGLIPSDRYRCWPARNYEAVDAALEVIIKQARKGDWIIFDKAGEMWKFTQQYYLMRAENKTRADTLLDAARKGKKGWDIFREINFSVVNALYDEVMGPLLFETPAHTYLTASASALYDNDSKEARDLFGRIGMKPEAQKGLPYQVRTILYLRELPGGTRAISTAKDRERAYLVDAPNKSIVMSYLMPTAGWVVQDLQQQPAAVPDRAVEVAPGMPQ